MNKPKNLAQSVGFGVGTDAPLSALGAMTKSNGILSTLADDANLPETIEEVDKSQYHELD